MTEAQYSWQWVSRIGEVAYLGLSRLLSSLAYGVSERDPIAAIIGVAGLAVVALIASWLPARRAARVNAVQALRSELNPTIWLRPT